MHLQRNGIPLDCSSTLALHDQHPARWKLPTVPPQAHGNKWHTNSWSSQPALASCTTSKDWYTLCCGRHWWSGYCHPRGRSVPPTPCVGGLQPSLLGFVGQLPQYHAKAQVVVHWSYVPALPDPHQAFRQHRCSQQCKITVMRKSLNRWRWRRAGPVCPLVCGKLANRSQRFPCANPENAQVRSTCKPSTLLPSATYIQFCASSVDSISR